MTQLIKRFFQNETLSYLFFGCATTAVNWISYTFFVDCGEGKRSYVLQKLNLEIFKDPVALMSNIKGVCSHIKEKIKAEGGDVLREVRTVIETKAGEDYYVDREGGYWRAVLAIDNVVSYDFPDSPELFYKSAVAFGKFARYMPCCKNFFRSFWTN